MSLTLPTTIMFYALWGEDADDVDNDRANLMIQLAADLLWLATGLDDDSTDTRLNMLIQYGILDMAMYLYISRDDINAEYAPFLSERVGSYSYSKSYSRVNSAVQSNQPTNVPFFDKVVGYLTEISMDAVGGGWNGWSSSEHVYRKGYVPLWRAVWQEFDPYIDGPRGAFWSRHLRDPDEY